MTKTFDHLMGSFLVLHMPEVVRKALYADTQFCTSVGIRTRSSVTLGKGPPVVSDSLINALRKAIAGHKGARILLANGKHERVKIAKKNKATVLIYRGGTAFQFDDVDVLVPGRDGRAKALERLFGERPLTSPEERHWHDVARLPLTHPQFVELMTALGATPESVSSVVSKTRQITVQSLMPLDSKYFYRLLAPPNESLTFLNFIEIVLRDARSHALDRNPTVGLRRIAYSNLWRGLIPFDILKDLEPPQIALLLSAVDPFSLLLGFELCANGLNRNLALGRLGTQFLDVIFGDSQRLRERCEIFGACAILSTVTLRRLFKEAVAPLYWVRLAALTHASVLTDALRGLSSTSDFLKWAIDGFGPVYHWETLYDRRDAPRWRAEWITPPQLIAELYGRCVNAIGAITGGSVPKDWEKVLATFREQSEPALIGHSMAPGPFDEFSPATAPPEVAELFERFEAELKSTNDLSTVQGLAGLAYLTTPSEQIVQELIRLLDLSRARPVNADVLDNCAHIAAATRCEPLASVVIAQCLYGAHVSESNDALAQYYTIAVAACAAISDSAKYRQMLGNTSAALAINAPGTSSMAGLKAIFEALTCRDPKLLSSLSRASALVEAVEFRRPPNPRRSPATSS